MTVESVRLSVCRPVRRSELSALAALLDGDLQRAHALQLHTAERRSLIQPELVPAADLCSPPLLCCPRCALLPPAGLQEELSSSQLLVDHMNPELLPPHICRGEAKLDFIVPSGKFGLHAAAVHIQKKNCLNKNKRKRLILLSKLLKAEKL